MFFEKLVDAWDSAEGGMREDALFVESRLYIYLAQVVYPALPYHSCKNLYFTNGEKNINNKTFIDWPYTPAAASLHRVRWREREKVNVRAALVCTFLSRQRGEMTRCAQECERPDRRALIIYFHSTIIIVVIIFFSHSIIKSNEGALINKKKKFLESFHTF